MSSSSLLIQPRDLRETPLWKTVSTHFDNLYSPAFGKVSGASDLDASPSSDRLAFTGSILDKLQDGPRSRICVASVQDRSLRVVTGGPNSDRHARWSPDGRSLAFLSDRQEKGVFQAYVLDADSLGEATALGSVPGTAEFLSWSEDGTRLLLGVAGRGADLGGFQGSGTAKGKDEVLPDWMPKTQPGGDVDPWRTAWIYNRKLDTLSQVGEGKELNFWEAIWCGPNHLVGVVSSSPDEAAWYSATLTRVDIASGSEHFLYRSERQIAFPTVSPSGNHVALLEAISSDRGLMAGDIRLVDIVSGSTEIIPANNVDASRLIWKDDTHLFFIGLRGLDTVAGILDVETKIVEEIWTSEESCGGLFPDATLLPGTNHFALILESWTRYQEVSLVADRKVHTVVSLSHPGAGYLGSKVGPIERVSWTGPDDLEIQSFLITPLRGKKPYPMVMVVHGGPCAAFKNQWTLQYPLIGLCVAAGYAVLCPNPRGSKGRGHDFTAGVYGDMGGKDAHDLLAGVQAMIDRGIADRNRIGVQGGSYGGYMSAWLPTLSPVFAASVPLAPISDWISMHTTSNTGDFDVAFLASSPYDISATNRFQTRSPVLFAGRHPTPVLLIAGAQDKCTPPSQAVQYYNALREKKVRCALAVYPKEGHGIKSWPAFLDYCVRVLAWFDEFMPVEEGRAVEV